MTSTCCRWASTRNLSLGPTTDAGLVILQTALDEAKHLISLHHPSVVTYHDVFVHRDSEAKLLQLQAKEENRRSGLSHLVHLVTSLFASKKRGMSVDEESEEGAPDSHRNLSDVNVLKSR